MKRSNHVANAGGDKWKSLTEEKAPYVAKAAKLKADYTKTMVTYNKGQSGGGGGSRVAAVDEAEEEGEESDKKGSAELALPLPSTTKRTTMNGKKGSSIQINICLPSNATPQSKSMKKSTKNHNGKATIPMRKLMMEVWEFTKEDTDRVTFSLKVGLACLLVSLLILIPAPYQVFGTNFILEKVEEQGDEMNKKNSNLINWHNLNSCCMARVLFCLHLCSDMSRLGRCMFLNFKKHDSWEQSLVFLQAISIVEPSWGALAAFYVVGVAHFEHPPVFTQLCFVVYAFE
ncbi:hypothetical protein ZIOFF_001065 [Zingiber officinale]|uniref:HMG box domain-containing protein n=1 Tax=Zingiber officinale TaxID=94328 RepID=A0A8J5M8A3_ZINOF|nr:hypothetical protein ZIOFF_001065 [Zingiber officinale]